MFRHGSPEILVECWWLMSQFITEDLCKVRFFQELTFLAFFYKCISYTWSLLLNQKQPLFFSDRKHSKSWNSGLFWTRGNWVKKD